MKKLLILVIMAASLTHASNAEDGSNWIDPKDFIAAVNLVKEWNEGTAPLTQFYNKKLGYPTDTNQHFSIPLPILMDLVDKGFKFNGSLQNIKGDNAYLRVNQDVQVYLYNQVSDTIPFNDINIHNSNCQNCYKNIVMCKAQKPAVQCLMEPQGPSYTTGCSYKWVCSIE